MSGDILQELNETHLTDVLMTLGRDYPDSIHMHSFLLNFMVWSELTDAVEMHFYCPNGNTIDGSVFAIAKFKNGPTYISFHCVELHPDYILDYLRKTQVFNWTEDIIFEAVHERLVPLLKTFIAEKKLKIIKDDIVRQVWIKPKKAKKMFLLVPDPLYIAPMKREEFKYVKQYWEFNEPMLEVVVNETLNNNCAIGLYHRANDSIMGWAVEQHYGGIGMLYVSEEYRYQGYGATLIQAMTHRLIDRQLDPYAFIQINNNKSFTLFKKQGFKQICLAHWISTTKL